MSPVIGDLSFLEGACSKNVCIFRPTLLLAGIAIHTVPHIGLESLEPRTSMYATIVVSDSHVCSVFTILQAKRNGLSFEACSYRRSGLDYPALDYLSWLP